MDNPKIGTKISARSAASQGAIMRLAVGVIISLLVNGAAFGLASTLLGNGGPLSPLRTETAEVSLHLEPRPATPAALLRPSPTPTPTPVPTPTATPLATPTPGLINPTPTPAPTAKPAPRRSTVRAEGAHNHLIVRRATRVERPTPQDFTIQSGGNARAGQVMGRQSAGNAVAAPDAPTAPFQPAATPEPTPVAAPAARTAETPRPTPTPAPTPTPTPIPPKITGPTRDAEPSSTVKPRIPDTLKQGGFKGFVRVKVQVHADGTFEPILRTSSGNPEVDERVLEALKQWKWKPKLVNGVPQESTELFKFELEVS